MEAKLSSDLSAVLAEQIGSDSKGDETTVSEGFVQDHGVCAICLDKILIQEAAIVKGCDHAYCVICILRWTTYKDNPFCPQCKHPFESLYVHRSLDGRIHSHVFEESVYLLLGAAWFVPLVVGAQEDAYEEDEDLLQYNYDDRGQHDDYDDDDDDELDEAYSSRGSSSIRIGNRRWGQNGFVRAGRKEARPLNLGFSNDMEAGSSRQPRKKEASSNAPATGRRAKRALKREAADKAASAAGAAKHQQHLKRLGRK